MYRLKVPRRHVLRAAFPCGRFAMYLKGHSQKPNKRCQRF
jgi:hypothetical protein